MFTLINQVSYFVSYFLATLQIYYLSNYVFGLGGYSLDNLEFIFACFLFCFRDIHPDIDKKQSDINISIEDGETVGCVVENVLP